MVLFGNKIKVPSPSPRIMSPMGFAVNRQARHVASVMDENSLYGDDYDPDDDNSYLRPVPIWLCVFLVVGYIIGGAFLFRHWEKWEFLDAAYFCFISNIKKNIIYGLKKVNNFLIFIDNFHSSYYYW